MHVGYIQRKFASQHENYASYAEITTQTLPHMIQTSQSCIHAETARKTLPHMVKASQSSLKVIQVP